MKIPQLFMIEKSARVDVRLGVVATPDFTTGLIILFVGADVKHNKRLIATRHNFGTKSIVPADASQNGVQGVSSKTMKRASVYATRGAIISTIGSKMSVNVCGDGADRKDANMEKHGIKILAHASAHFC